MREIGCQAFVLIPTHNPKIQPCSIESILIGYGQNLKTYRCWDKHNLKVYQSHHVKFIECHKLPPNIQLSPTPKEPGQPSIPTLQQLDDSASTTPHHVDNDLSHLEVVFNAPEQVPQVTDQAFGQQIINLHRTTCTYIPTKKTADDKNRQPTRMERTMEQVKESAKRVREQKEERRAKLVLAIEEEHIQPPIKSTPTAEQAPTLVGDQMPTPTADPAKINHYRILAAILQSGDINPLPLDLEEEPSTWREAQKRPDVDKWAEAYQEELKSLKEMGVYQLIPWSEVLKGQKI